MNHISSTPFGSRPVSISLIDTLRTVERAAPLPQIDKWEVFRQIAIARHAFGLTDRDLAVLNALLSFHRGKTMGDNEPLVVFPSNRALSERAHGMPESTLRRHLAVLVASGLVMRRDSPNGKRYAHKDRQGEIMRAFGFDLRPILVRAEEIARAATAARDAADRIKALRIDVSLMKRDAVKFALYGQESGLAGDWTVILDKLLAVQGLMRRKMRAEELEGVRRTVSQILNKVEAMLMTDTDQMSGSDVLDDRQLQNSNKEDIDSEPYKEKQEAQGVDTPTSPIEIKVPLGLVVKACPDLLPYSEDEVRDWNGFVRASEFVRTMMGISPSGYQEACQAMGRQAAAVAVACILQRISEIKSPGGYLRSLARKAQVGNFSVGPMVMALLNGAKC